ncbi:MAG: cytochrome c biogenesis protein CcdA [bacterium]
MKTARRMLPILLLGAVALLLTGCESPLDFAAASKQGSLWQFVAAFVGGMAICLTPCVFPLIPITVSVFGGLPDGSESKGKRRLRAALTGATYILGIALTYSTLGLLAGLAGKETVGEHLGSAWVIVPLFGLFIALAASMFGAFELQLPVSWQSKLSGVGGTGLWGGFLMGLVAGLLAAPCTGPIITGILVYIASTQNAFLGFWLLFTFSMGFGLMFLVIAAFASVMPKSGPWMEGVKSTLGVILLVMALYYLSALLPVLERVRLRETWIVVTGAGLSVFGILLGGIHLTFHERKLFPIARKLVGVLTLSAGLFLSLQYYRGSSVKAQYTSVPKCLAAAKKAKRPILMDFWATWCEKCIELEKTTLAHPRVAKVLKRRFVFCKVDCTKKNDQTKATKQRFGVKGLPTLVLIDSNGKRVKNVVGLVTPDELLKILKKIE